MASHGGATAASTAAAEVARRTHCCRVRDYWAEKLDRLANETPATAPSPPLWAAANEPSLGGAAGGAAAAGSEGREAQVSPAASARAPRFRERPQPCENRSGSDPSWRRPAQALRYELGRRVCRRRTQEDVDISAV